MRQKTILLLLLFLFPSTMLLAGAGFLDTIFGDGEHEFVCYTRIHRNFYLVIFFAALLMAIIVFRLYRLRARHARGLEEKNNIIEQQQRDIMSSIRYARRIQQAQLMPNDEIRRIVPQSFFFLCPRDIVSGDFYWIQQHGENIFIAAADCTGHGVPGAFLSFIGHSALHRAISEKGITDPSQIIDEVNTDVKRMLGQQRAESELDDGMEMAVCVWNPASRHLRYAGAGIPLYLFRSGQFEEIKAVKCSVGSVQHHITNPPPTHSFHLSSGDCFYSGSDGIADQFGGPDGKKLKSQGLKKFLSSLQEKPFAEQESLLRRFLDEWRGNNSQTDDMLLLGVKVS